MKLAPGQTFGRYLIEGFIGQGGMGRVFRAQDTTLERPVALKVILPDQASDAETVARFFREAKLAAKIAHPNTVRLYDLGEIEGVPFMAMELIDGRSLVSFIEDATVSAERKMKWMLGVARGLAAAHAQGLVHRDVKPANVMVSLADDDAKIVDFGLAKRIKTTPVLRSTFQTMTGFVLGTPAYMAPEALAGEPADARSDQFGWALTVYTVVAGRNPRANDPMLERPIAMLSDLVPAVPRRAALVVMRALSADPAMRFRDMSELGDALAEALLTGTLVPAPIPPEKPREKPPEPLFRPIHPFADARIWSPGKEPARPKEPPAPPTRPSPGIQAERARKAADENARLSMKRMRLIAERPFSFAKAGYTRHKQAQALAGSPSPEAVKQEKWFFSLVQPRLPSSHLRVTAIGKDGRMVFAIGRDDRRDVPLVYAGTRWEEITLDGVRADGVECARFVDDERIAIGGQDALAAVLSFDGRIERWSLPSNVDRDVTFAAVDARARRTDGALELAFVGGDGRFGIAAIGAHGRLRRYDSATTGPLVGVAIGSVVMVAGKQLGIVTEEGGIDNAGTIESSRGLVRIDKSSAVSIGKRAFTYFAPLAATSWPELPLEPAEPVMGASADRTETYALDATGSLMRRSASWTWVHLTDGKARAKDPIAMWAGSGRVRIVCKDGSIVDGHRSG